MRFTYQYKTHENERREGEICAASREDVFTQLKKQGIRPFMVQLAPGFFNRLQSYGKRSLAILILSIVVITLASVSLVLWHDDSRRESGVGEFDAMTRRQVVGDTAIVEKNIKNGWADVFEGEGERFLASFAVPGVPAGQRNTSEAEIRSALARHIVATGEDGIEARQIKAMVEGMKEEARRFVSKGGSIAQYGRLLVQRQEEEIGYFNRAKSEVEAAQKRKSPAHEVERIWEDRNNRLRRMGIKLVPMPE